MEIWVIQNDDGLIDYAGYFTSKEDAQAEFPGLPYSHECHAVKLEPGRK